MLETILNKYEFGPLKGYIKKLNSEIISEEKDEFAGGITINIQLKNGLNLSIFIPTAFAEKDRLDCIYFSFFSNQIIVEQVTFMLLNTTDYDYNRVIRHDYYTVNDDGIAKTFNSAYKFAGDKYLTGWERIREVLFKDIESFARIDDLGNFSRRIDVDNIATFYSYDEEDIKKEPVIDILALKR